MAKSKLTQRRFKAPKKSACAMCKPFKRGHESKYPISTQRASIGHDQQLKDVKK